MISFISRQQTTNSKSIIQEIKSIVSQAAASEKSGQWQEALDLYEDARFLALDSGLNKCDVYIEPKSATVETELTLSKRTQISAMLQTAMRLESNNNLAKALDVYKKAFKFASDIDAMDIMTGILEAKARLERELMPVKISKKVSAMRAIGNMLVLLSLMVLITTTWELLGTGLIFLTVCMMMAGSCGLFTILVIPTNHVKAIIIITIMITTFYMVLFEILYPIVSILNLLQIHNALTYYGLQVYNALFYYGSYATIINAIIIFLLGFAITFFIASYQARKSINEKI